MFSHWNIILTDLLTLVGCSGSLREPLVWLLKFARNDTIGEGVSGGGGGWNKNKHNILVVYHYNLSSYQTFHKWSHFKLYLSATLSLDIVYTCTPVCEQ